MSILETFRYGPSYGRRERWKSLGRSMFGLLNALIGLVLGVGAAMEYHQGHYGHAALDAMIVTWSFLWDLHMDIADLKRMLTR